MKRRRRFPVWLLLAVIIAAGAGAYFFLMRPRSDSLPLPGERAVSHGDSEEKITDTERETLEGIIEKRTGDGP